MAKDAATDTNDALSAVADALTVAADALATDPPAAAPAGAGVSPETLQKIVAAAQAIIQACAPGAAAQGEGEDTNAGDAGADTVSGGGGADSVAGDECGGKDTVGGDAGGDIVSGDAGADTVAGDGGKDTMKTEDQTGADALDNLDVTNPEALKRVIVAQGRTISKLSADLAAANSKPGFDAAEFTKEIAARDTLADRLKAHVGAFDHSAMSLAEVAKYGCDKLNLKDIPEGSERVALDGFLAGRADPSTVAATHEGDAAPRVSAVKRHLAGEAASA